MNIRETYLGVFLLLFSSAFFGYLAGLSTGVLFFGNTVETVVLLDHMNTEVILQIAFPSAIASAVTGFAGLALVYIRNQESASLALLNEDAIPKQAGNI